MEKIEATTNHQKLMGLHLIFYSIETVRETSDLDNEMTHSQ